MRLAVVAVIITASKSLAEIILILAHINVVSVVAVRCIAKRVGVLRIELPVVLAIRLASTKAFVVTLIHCSPQQVSAILVQVEGLAGARVAVDWRTVIIVSETLQPYLVLAQALPITLLKAPLRQATLLLEVPFALFPPGAIPVSRSCPKLILALLPHRLLLTLPSTGVSLRRAKLLLRLWLS